MLAAFIDFKKPYDRIDRSKLWRCLKGAGLKGRMMYFLGKLSLKLHNVAVYEDKMHNILNVRMHTM